MEMLVRVNVIEFEAGRREGLELGFDLGGKLAAHMRQEKHRGPGPHHIVAEEAVGAYERRNFRGRQRRPPLDQHQMQAHAQAPHRLGALHRVGGGRRRDHQAGGGEYAFLVGAFDRVVDRERRSEIVRRDNQLLFIAARICRKTGAHLFGPRGQETIMSSRVRRNWKNSTPSRSRRTSISQDVSISPTISAIFEGRK